MKRLFHSAFTYLRYLFKRKDEHALHSPFLFDFYTKTVLRKKQFVVEDLEKYRASLLANTAVIPVQDFGTGPGNAVSITVKQMAGGSLSSVTQQAFLSALTFYLAPATVLEIGTSFGLSGLYLQQHLSGSFISLEGNEQIAAIAQQAFLKLGKDQARIVTGEFSSTLPQVLRELPSLDLVFFDGNHQFEPTLLYFEQCLQKINERSVFVFHDIYWSEGMTKAWNEICHHPQVTLSLDLYFFGIVFFRSNQPKQHFCLKF